MTPIRLAVVASHPIQYFAPLYRALARHPGIDLRVFFLSRQGLAPGLDAKMGVSVAWAMDLTGGYPHDFLLSPDKRRNVERLLGSDAPTLGRHLRRFEPQAVLVHGYAHIVCLRAIFWSWWRRLPLLMISDGSFDAGSGRMRLALKHLILPKLLARVSAFLPLGERGERFLRGWGVGPDKLHRLPLAPAEPFMQPRDGAREALRRAWGVGEGDIVILAVGKLYKEKRVGDLIEALAGLEPPPDRRILCVIAGDGALRGEWEARARELDIPALFPGFVNLDRLPDFFRAADIFVHPAEREQYGIAVLEAACAGLPLVMSDRVGALAPTDVAREGLNALGYPAGDVSRLRDALHRLIADRALRSRMGRASRAITAHHTPDHGAQAVFRALHQQQAST
ncbi:MAG: glycosyltransferase family 4 protein [Methylobacterium mesophilicum]|nr:glycosyltransferase family 4 protein [Methylobacterium mesophilicum]